MKKLAVLIVLFVTVGLLAMKLSAANAPVGKQFVSKIVVTEMNNGKETVLLQVHAILM